MIEPVQAYGWCILQVTLLSAAACGIYLATRRMRAAGNVALLATSLASVGLLTLLSLSPWPRWSWQPRWQPPSPVGASAAATPTVAVEALPPADESPLRGPPATPHDDSPAANHLAPQEAVWAPGVGIAAAGWHWRAILVVTAWLAGIVGLVRFGVGLLHLRRCRRRSVPICDAILTADIEELGRHLCGIRRIDLRESATAGVPATIGWFRPTILLPGTWRGWSPDERRAVLAHEMAHVAGGHFRAWSLGQLALAAHLYHPLVHWLARRLRLELELSADQVAAGAFGDRQQYAAALAGIALGRQPRPAFASIGLLMTRPLLMRRIAMLRRAYEHPVASRSSRRLMFLLIPGTTLAVAGLRGGPSVAAANADASPPADATASRIAELPETPAADSKTASGKPYVVTALFEVSRQPPSVLGTDQQPVSDAAWATFCNTQVALLKSDFVLQAALRDPKIASLPLVHSEADAVSWLRGRLEVGFRPGSAILAVQMRGNDDELDQLKQLVDAVVRAYQNEVVYSQRQRPLNTRDALAKSLDQLRAELARKTEEAHAIAVDIGSAEYGGVGQIEQQLALKRLDRIEAELMRLENEQLAAQLQAEQSSEPTPEMTTNLKFYEQRIAQLRGRQEELEKKVKASSETSVDVQARVHEVEQLQRLVDEMTMKLEAMDVETRGAPDRIRLIQPAVVSRAAGTSPGASTPSK